MTKIITATIFSLAITATAHATKTAEPSSCTAQVWKQNMPGANASVLVVCGNKIVHQSDIAPFAEMSALEIAALKAHIVKGMFSAFADQSTVKCVESDSQLLWVAACYKP